MPRKALIWLLLVMFLFPVWEATPAAAAPGDPIAIDLATIAEGASGDGYSYSSGYLTISDEGPFQITTSSLVSGRGIVVDTVYDVQTNITLDDVNITNNASGAYALALTGSSNVDLTISGTNTLVSGANRAALEVPFGTEITLNGTDADTLTCTGGKNASGIGGGYSVTPAVAGTITISGGTIVANGGEADGGTGAGAGIGGGRGGSGGTIVIDGGVVTGNGGYRAAGIGGGQGGNSGSILIRGGVTTATARTSSYSAGIGGGFNAFADTIIIEGGTVNATGHDGAGIGAGGVQSIFPTVSAGNIQISGGTITATSNGQGAGIGNGLFWYSTCRKPVTVTVTGGTIDASSASGPGIGGALSTINITDGDVTAQGGNNSAGIGAGFRTSGGVISISGGTITATGGSCGSGIGSGDAYDESTVLDGGTIDISGGVVVAVGGYLGAGIGGGNDSDAGIITLTGGEITATGGWGGSGIGIGGVYRNADDGEIVISQANVTATADSGTSSTRGDISAGANGTIHIGFTGPADASLWTCDPQATQADITFGVNGFVPSSCGTLVLGTCLIDGEGAGDLAGQYIEGVKQVPTYTIEPITDHTFAGLVQGYAAEERQALTVTVENTGTGVLNNLAAALSGANAGSFAVTQPAFTSLSDEVDTTTFTVIPNPDLSLGTYTATVTVSADNMDDVSFTVTLEVSEVTYTVTYDGNGNTGGTVPSDANGYTAGSEAILLGNTGDLVRTSYTFAGWNTQANGEGTSYEPGDEITVSGNVTLYAAWSVVRDDSPPPPPIVVETEVSGNSTTQKTTATPRLASGTASFNVSGRMIDALLKKAASSSATGENDSMGVEVRTPDSVSKMSAVIGRSYLGKVVSRTDSSFFLKAPFISVTFDKKALETISETTLQASVTITAGVSDEAELSKDERVKGRPVYDFNVASGQTKVTQFGDGHAHLRIPYNLKEGEDPNHIVVYTLADDGGLQVVRGRYDVSASEVAFKTSRTNTFVIGHNPVSFRDVEPGDWYKEAVDFIAAREITRGTGDGYFSPETPLTRGQYVVLLLNAYGLNTDGVYKGNEVAQFDDAGDTYYTDYLLAARKLGIVTGIGMNLFGPELAITRQEMSVMVHNALTLLGEPLEPMKKVRLADFADADQVASWAKTALDSLVQAAVISGSDGLVTPSATATRAQIAKVLYELLNR